MNEGDAPLKLGLKVLKRLHEAGVLQDIVLIGSWCVYFYKDHFSADEGISTLRTRDMDFLVSTPPKLKNAVDVPTLLKELDFIPDAQHSGWIRHSHPDLIIDFMVPEKAGSSSSRTGAKRCPGKSSPSSC